MWEGGKARRWWLEVARRCHHVVYKGGKEEFKSLTGHDFNSANRKTWMKAKRKFWVRRRNDLEIEKEMVQAFLSFFSSPLWTKNFFTENIFENEPREMRVTKSAWNKKKKKAKGKNQTKTWQSKKLFHTRNGTANSASWGWGPSSSLGWEMKHVAF